LSRIYWDTRLFVYWLEDHPDYAGRVQQIHGKMLERGDRLCTSAFTAGEVLTGGYKRGAAAFLAEVRSFFQSPHLEVIPFTTETADRYARIRAEHRVSPADAIHLATAAQSGVDLFLTNDRALSRLVIPGIQFIAGLDVGLF
jgi:predicted nucleic acid-binding protein